MPPAERPNMASIDKKLELLTQAVQYQQREYIQLNTGLREHIEEKFRVIDDKIDDLKGSRQWLTRTVAANLLALVIAAIWFTQGKHP